MTGTLFRINSHYLNDVFTGNESINRPRVGLTFELREINHFFIIISELVGWRVVGLKSIKCIRFVHLLFVCYLVCPWKICKKRVVLYERLCERERFELFRVNEIQRHML